MELEMSLLLHLCWLGGRHPGLSEKDTAHVEGFRGIDWTLIKIREQSDLDVRGPALLRSDIRKCMPIIHFADMFTVLIMCVL